MASVALSQFAMQYAALIAEYNSSPGVRNGTNEGLADFLKRRDALVQATREQLFRTLTPGGYMILATKIQKEKTKMKVPKEEAIQ
ncbi:MAG: hypothetical protein ACRD52_02260 [Candidatus Acidiferrales bacterium]